MCPVDILLFLNIKKLRCASCRQHVCLVNFIWVRVVAVSLILTKGQHILIRHFKTESQWKKVCIDLLEILWTGVCRKSSPCISYRSNNSALAGSALVFIWFCLFFPSLWWGLTIQPQLAITLLCGAGLAQIYTDLLASVLRELASKVCVTQHLWQSYKHNCYN